MATERLRVILELVTGQYKREASQAAAATSQIAGAAQTTGVATGRLGTQMGALATTAKFAIAGAATAAVVGFAKDSIRAASDAEESINAVQKTFGTAADRVLEFSKVASQAAGLSKTEFNSLATVTGALLTNMGFGFDEAAQQSIKLTTRAADLASVFNTDVSTALEAVNSGLQGQSRPLRQFGIDLSDAAIRAKAVELGLAKTTAEVDRHGKAVAALELFYEQSAQAQGDFIQTSESLANQQRINAAELENLKAAFGDAFTPFAAGFLAGPVDLMQEIQALFGNDAPLRMREATERLFDSLRMGTPRAEALAEALGHIADRSDLTADQVRTLGATLGLTDEDVADLTDEILAAAEASGLGNEALEDLEDALNGVAPAADDAADGISRFGGEQNQVPRSNINKYLEDQRLAFDRAAEAQRHWQEAQRGTAQLLREAADPAIAAAGAVQRYQEAQDELTGVLEDSEASERDLAAAKLAVAEAALEAQAAIDEFSGDNTIRAATAISDALGISTDEAYELLDALGLLDGRVVTTYVNTIFRSQGTQGSTGRNTQIGGRQHGGPVRAGEFYQVGERNQPELLMIPGDNGRVFSNSDVRALIRAFEGGGARGGDLNISLNGSGDVAHDMGTVATIAGIMRRVEGARR